ncbi:MAG: exodeoxyribonuclease VII large subunit [Saprospiraceae bacterium]|nr:exodeoxyribonuclease VII large subunit [Saprospiraceae bacterium]MBP7680180.1 exodeoxyribonuclease VII large subunit [Saprospiraceae bacterium]
MESVSLFELNEYLRRVVALNFTQALWVTAEISQLNSSKGHYYLDLLQKDNSTDLIVAQAQAVIWAGQMVTIRRKLGDDLAAILQEGMQVLIQITVDFHERYGLKLVIQDIDLSYSIGQMYLQRKRIIEALLHEGLIEKNARLSLPTVLQRIAIISSERAAGYQDFIKQLTQNPYRYRFSYRLFQATMQGNTLEGEVVAQLENIARQAEQFDVVVIIRGGGAKLDLASFDSLPLGRAIANMNLPVITGIGHDIDETIADLVAHQSLKTPTAVAEFIVQRNVQYEATMEGFYAAIQQYIEQHIRQEHFDLQQAEQLIPLYVQQLLKDHQVELQHKELSAQQALGKTLKSEEQQLRFLEQSVAFLSLENTLQRGFSITLCNGKVITDSQQVAHGNRLTTLLRESEITSIVM